MSAEHISVEKVKNGHEASASNTKQEDIRRVKPEGGNKKTVAKPKSVSKSPPKTNQRKKTSPSRRSKSAVADTPKIVSRTVPASSATKRTSPACRAPSAPNIQSPSKTEIVQDRHPSADFFGPPKPVYPSMVPVNAILQDRHPSANVFGHLGLDWSEFTVQGQAGFASSKVLQDRHPSADYFGPPRAPSPEELPPNTIIQDRHPSADFFGHNPDVSVGFMREQSTTPFAAEDYKRTGEDNNTMWSVEPEAKFSTNVAFLRKQSATLFTGEDISRPPTAYPPATPGDQDHDKFGILKLSETYSNRTLQRPQSKIKFAPSGYDRPPTAYPPDGVPRGLADDDWHQEPEQIDVWSTKRQSDWLFPDLVTARPWIIPLTGKESLSAQRKMSELKIPKKDENWNDDDRIEITGINPSQSFSMFHSCDSLQIEIMPCEFRQQLELQNRIYIKWTEQQTAKKQLYDEQNVVQVKNEEWFKATSLQTPEQIAAFKAPVFAFEPPASTAASGTDAAFKAPVFEYQPPASTAANGTDAASSSMPAESSAIPPDVQSQRIPRTGLQEQSTVDAVFDPQSLDDAIRKGSEAYDRWQLELVLDDSLPDNGEDVIGPLGPQT